MDSTPPLAVPAQAARCAAGAASSERPRVAVYAAFYVETFVYDQLSRLTRYRSVVLTRRIKRRADFPHDLLCVSPDSDAYGLGVRYWAERLGYALRLKRYPPTDRAQDARWSDALRAHRVALIHAHHGIGGLRILPVAVRHGLPLIVTFHGADASKWVRLRAYRRKLRRLFGDAALLLAVSDYFRQRLIELGCPPEKIAVHHVGVDVDRFAWRDAEPPVEPEFRFVDVCRFEEKKGLEYLIRAFRRVADAVPGARLRLIGAGALEDALRRLVSDERLEERVVFTGMLPHREVCREMGAAHVFVQPSVTAANGDQEGIPTTLMEAMSAGVPVISTKHSGIPEIVEDGRSGILVGERDVGALADAMIRLARSPEERRRFALAGRRHVVAEHNILTQVERLEAFYDAVLGRRKP